jgi:lysophospholipase L1-like esterase
MLLRQLLSLFLVAAVALDVAVALRLPQLKILALGDSITFGCGSDAAPPDWYACCLPTSGGYRAPLWAALNGSGINASILMVGTESNGPSWVPVEQRAHEGHPGWTIAGIHGLRSKWQALAPDVVLLMAGTNDVGQGHTNASMAADYDALLQDLRADLPAGRIFMTTILNLPDNAHPDFAATIPFFNRVTLPPLAAKHGADYVDINGATGMCYGPNNTLTNLCAVCNGPCGGYNPASCPPTGYSLCHPTGAGYNLVAGVWANALLPVLGAMAAERALLL